MHFLLTIHRNRHLPVSENAVLCFIIFLYPLYKLFVYLFTVARCSLSPLVVSGTWKDEACCKASQRNRLKISQKSLKTLIKSTFLECHLFRSPNTKKHRMVLTVLCFFDNDTSKFEPTQIRQRRIWKFCAKVNNRLAVSDAQNSKFIAFRTVRRDQAPPHGRRFAPDRSLLHSKAQMSSS